MHIKWVKDMAESAITLQMQKSIVRKIFVGVEWPIFYHVPPKSGLARMIRNIFTVSIPKRVKNDKHTIA
jgi:hypothetical protein